MRTIVPLSSLALLLLCAAPAVAAEWHVGGAQLPTSATADPVAAVKAHVFARRAELGLDGIELGSVVEGTARITTSSALGRVVRFAQTVDGVPVLGASVVVRLAEGRRVERVAVEVARNLSVDTVPSLDVQAAHQSLITALGHDVPAPERAELVIGRFGTGVLLYQLDVRDSLGGTRYFVNAHDGALVATRELALHAQGTVYSANAVETPIPVDLPLDLLDETAVPVRLNGWSGLFSVTNYVDGPTMAGDYTVEQTLGPSAGTDFLFPPPASALDPADAFAQVNLYFHITNMRTYFETLGVDFSSASHKITAIANAKDNGAALDNAFFSQMGLASGPFAAPNLIAIGQGSTADFAYDSDVFKHEFGHYVSQNEVGYNLGQAYSDDLGLSPWSGSIDEGIADYFACSANDDAELGEASLALIPGGSVRDLTDISKTCPDDMIAEVHADGELVGSFSWSLRVALGAAAADQLVWGAVASLPEGGDFNDFAQGILATAAELVTAGDLTAADVTTINTLMAERGLDKCSRIQTLAEGDTSRTTIFGLDLIGALFGQTCSTVQGFGIALPGLFHYSFTPAANDIAVRFNADMTPDGGGSVSFTIWGRKNQPVAFKPGFMNLLPEVDLYDYKIDVTSANGALVIDAASDPPFDPTATYDFVVTSTSCPTLAAELSAGAFVPPPPGEGGGGAGAGGSPAEGGTGGAGGGQAGDDAEDDDGCGCTVPGAPDSAPGALLGFAAMALLASRRRTKR